MSATEVRPLRYALGSIGTGVFSTTPSVLLLYFCTDILGLAPAVAALIVFAPKIASLLWDPFVGNWSDRTMTRWGRRAPFMIVGALGMAGGFIAVFAPPALSESALGLWVGAAYFAMAGFFSLYAVPYIAMPAEAPGGGEAAARMVAWRMALMMLGVILGAALAPVLVSLFGGGRGGYAAMGVVVATICVIAMIVPTFSASRTADVDRGAEAKNGGLKRIWATPAFAPLAFAYVLQMGAVSVVSTCMPYLTTRVFARAESDVGMAMSVVLLCSLFAMPLWSWLGRKTQALPGAVVFYAIAALAPLALILAGAPWPAFVASLSLMGAGFAGLQVLPFTQLALIIRQSAPADEGLLTGVWTASEKIGLALGPALTGLALQAMGGASAAHLPYFMTFTPALMALLSLAPLLAAGRARA